MLRLLFFLTALLFAVEACASHGVSLDSNVKYSSEFDHFSYVNPDAPKRGKLVLHDIGSFDKINPYSFKGNSPLGVESLLFDSLGVESLDEPFSQYGLVAKDIHLADDRKSVTYTLNPLARFSNGDMVTAQDVAFTLETLKSNAAHPYFQYYYDDISGYEIIDPLTIRILFKRPNRELHMIAGQMNILSKKFFQKHNFADDNPRAQPVIPLGSGPYTIKNIIWGQSITYERNPHYWAKALPVRKGMYNFDEITVKYYKDETVALEAFKAGEFDFLNVNIAKQWATMHGKKFTDGTIIKKVFPHHNNQGIQGFLMNTRRDLFKDPRVRQALGLAFDFTWVNTALFFGEYTRSNSYFSNSYLAATGLPQGLELEYLEPFRNQLVPEVFTSPLQPPVANNEKEMRRNLIMARDLLKDAGWTVQDGVLRNRQGKPFRFHITLVTPSFERVMAVYVSDLARLGIQADYRTIDPALYVESIKKFDFDMITMVYGESQSPGNEQRDFWYSTSADRPGSKNYAGIKSPVVDEMVDHIIYAGTSTELQAACRALDRVLWYGYYLVPNWYLPAHRLAFHNKFSYPTTLPLYYDPFQLLMCWWAYQ